MYSSVNFDVQFSLLLVTRRFYPALILIGASLRLSSVLDLYELSMLTFMLLFCFKFKCYIDVLVVGSKGAITCWVARTLDGGVFKFK